MFCNIFNFIQTDLKHYEKINVSVSVFHDDLGSGPVPVVILTYMRSGSSFCGDVLQASDDVFYLFEPLRTIQFHFRKSNTFYYLNGNNR